MEARNLTTDLKKRPELGEFVMTTKVRTLLTVVAIGGASVFGAGARAAEMKGTPTAAQYAAIADDACVGVPAKERDMGLLAYRDAVVSVAPLKADYFMGKIKTSRTEGAVIGLRATPGITKPWLERVKSCHVALVGSGRMVGNDAASDPFVIAGTSVVVAETYAGYVLSVKGLNAETAQEITKRSVALQSTPASPATASLESH
jgi:hypothetical protein